MDAPNDDSGGTADAPNESESLTVDASDTRASTPADDPSFDTGDDAESAPSNPARLLLLVVAMICIPLGLILLALSFNIGQRPSVSQGSTTDQTLGSPQTAVLNFAPTLETLSGQWNVIGEKDSWVGYSVNEKLGPVALEKTTAGRTGILDGGFNVNKTGITNVAISADLSQLKSDDPKNDEAMKTAGLETNTYKTAAFFTDQPIPLDRVPKPGESIDVTAKGTFLIHNVTQPVEVKLQAKIVSGDPLVIEITGNVPIKFSDYGIVAPNVAGVSVVEDHAIMQIHLLLARVPDEVAAKGSSKGSTPGSIPASTPGSTPGTKPSR